MFKALIWSFLVILCKETLFIYVQKCLLSTPNKDKVYRTALNMTKIEAEVELVAFAG